QVRGIAARRQVGAEASDDVGDVSLALAQVGIVHAVEQRRHFVERALQGRLRVQALVADDSRRAIDEHRIVEHQELRVEEVRVLGPERGADSLLDVLDLAARPAARGVEPLELGLDAALRDAEAQVPDPAGDDQRPADADARRDAESAQLHDSSNPRSTSAHSAAMASRSSGPSAEIRIAQPCAAASSSSPMMLLPSTSRSPRATRICDWNAPAVWTNFAAARAWSPSVFRIGMLHASIYVFSPPRMRSEATQIALRPCSRMSRASVSRSVSCSGRASFISIARFSPVIPSTWSVSRNVTPRFAGVPPNMSVSTSTRAGRSGVSTFARTRAIACPIASRAWSTSSCQPIETAAKCGRSPTIISAAFKSSAASCPCVTTTTPTFMSYRGASPLGLPYTLARGGPRPRAARVAHALPLARSGSYQSTAMSLCRTRGWTPCRPASPFLRASAIMTERCRPPV